MDAVAIMLIIAGIMFLAGLLTIVFDRRKKGRCSVPAVASIVDVKRVTDYDDNGHKKTKYVPVFEFAAGAYTVRREGNVRSSSKRAYQIGDRREIAYNPQKPEEFIVDGKSGNAGAGIFLIVLSVLILAATIYFGVVKK